MTAHGSPRVRDLARLAAFKPLLQPHGVAPEMVHGHWLADRLVDPVAIADHDLVIRFTITVEAKLEAFDDESLGLVGGELRLPLQPEEWRRQVRAETGRDVIFLEVSTLMVNKGEEGILVFFFACHDELVKERVHLAAAVVHHPANISSVLVRPHAATVLVEVILEVELGQEITEILEVAHLAARTQERVLAHFRNAAYVLVTGRRAIRCESVGRHHDAPIVLQADDSRPSHDRLQCVLRRVDVVFARHCAGCLHNVRTKD
mmetsp:Transcript_42463/g.117157  ORF Transcript_42463/g.117157 Transcript_42463/m.117157 type:complete len:261 (+) Transcript_42463:103-885(+)